MFTAIKFISDLQLIAVTYEFLSEALFAIGLTICFHNVFTQRLRENCEFRTNSICIK